MFQDLQKEISRRKWASAKIWLPAISWAIFILVLSTVTVPEFDMPDIFFSIDKVVHFFFYGVLALFIILPLRSGSTILSPVQALLAAFIISAIYGIIIEVYQKFVGRFMEFGDAVANVIGAGLACLGYLMVFALKTKLTRGNLEQREHKAKD
jgi:VanZ family protein